MSDLFHGRILAIPTWEDRGGGRAWECDLWTTKFPSEMNTGAEGQPCGSIVTVANSHNAEPRQTLRVAINDTVNRMRDLSRPFAEIKGSRPYTPVGDAHYVLHRDYPWQEVMLKIIASSGGDLVRIYTWWYLVTRNYRWDQPVAGGPGKWVRLS